MRRRADEFLWTRFMIRPLAISLAAALSLLAAPFCGADEPDSVNHSEPITVRVLSGKDGQPLVHTHLILIAGYDQGEIRDQLWREETLTDALGQARLSKQFANLPWLQVWVDKKPLCQDTPRKTSFSVERIRRDGLSTPNRCGAATVEDAPGLFTVFVQTGKKDAPAKPAKANAPAPEATQTAFAVVETRAYKPAQATPPAHPLSAVAAAAPAKTASIATKAAPRIDLPDMVAFSIPASAPVVVSAGKPGHAVTRRPAKRVVLHKARRISHKARRKAPPCRGLKPSAKPAATKAPAKTADKTAPPKGTTAKAPAKKIDQKPKSSAGSKPATSAKPNAQAASPKRK